MVIQTESTGSEVVNKEDELARCEMIIQIAKDKARESFMDMGRALVQVKAGRLYKAAGYDKFDDWCSERMGIGRAHAYRLMEAVEIHGDLAHRLIPLDEAHKMLNRFDDPEASREIAPSPSPLGVLTSERHYRSIAPLWKRDQQAAAELVAEVASESTILSEDRLAEKVSERLGNKSSVASAVKPAKDTVQDQTDYSPAEAVSHHHHDEVEDDSATPEVSRSSKSSFTGEPISTAKGEPIGLVARVLTEAGYALLGSAHSGAHALPLQLSIPIDDGQVVVVEVRLKSEEEKLDPLSERAVGFNPDYKDPNSQMTFACPRCKKMTTRNFYGVCEECAEALNAKAAATGFNDLDTNDLFVDIEDEDEDEDEDQDEEREF